jgi:undecaprenyl-diphosphatase
MNNAIFFFFYNLAHRSTFFDKVVVFFAIYFPYIVVVLAALFLSRRFSRDPDLKVSGLFKKWKGILLVSFSAILAGAISEILKILIHLPRPLGVFSQVRPLFAETGYAFPSFHATLFMALAVSLFFYHKKAGYLFMFFALLIGLARIIAGVHFPIDILGGFVLGVLVAFLVRSV